MSAPELGVRRGDSDTAGDLSANPPRVVLRWTQPRPHRRTWADRRGHLVVHTVHSTYDDDYELHVI